MSKGIVEAIDDTKQYRQILEGHDDWVQSVSWSSAGIASGSADGSIIVFDQEGSLVHILEGHEADVYKVKWCPDLKHLASGSQDTTIRIWDGLKGKCIATLTGHEDVVRALTWEDRGRYLASGSQDCTLRIWEMASRSCIKTIQLESEIYCAEWSPKGRPYVAVGTDAGQLLIISTESGETTLQLDVPESSMVLCACWAPSALFLAAGSSDGFVSIFDQSGTCTARVEAHHDWVTGLSWSISNNIVTCGFKSDPTIKVWDANNGTCSGILEGHSDAVTDVCWSKDGSAIASASADTTVRLWDMNSMMGEEERKKRMGTGHDESVRACRFSWDGKMVASGSDDKTVRVYDAENGGRVQVMRDHGDWVTDLCWNPSNTKIATSCGDHLLRVWIVEDGQLDRVFRGHTAWVECIAWSPLGDIIASGAFEDDCTVKLWDVETGECVQTCKGHTDRVNSVAFSLDGGEVASASSDATIRIFDTETGDCRRCLEMHEGPVRCVEFNSSGDLLASCGDDSIVRIWDARTGKIVTSLAGHNKWVYSLAWAPEGDRVMSASEDCTVKLHSLNSKARRMPPGFQLDSPVFAVGWNGTKVVCACASGRMVQLHVPHDDENDISWGMSFKKTKKIKAHAGSVRAMPGSRAIASVDTGAESDTTDAPRQRTQPNRRRATKKRCTIL